VSSRAKALLMRFSVVLLGRKVGMSEVGQDRLVCDRRIVEGQRAVEISVARDAMCLGGLHPQERHERERALRINVSFIGGPTHPLNQEPYHPIRP
jgi:hypothetical protein